MQTCLCYNLRIDYYLYIYIHKLLYKKVDKMASDILKIDKIHAKLFNKTGISFNEDFVLRINNLINSHHRSFGLEENYRFFSSPGRIEICGNHTDHQNGKVLCGAVNLDTLACVKKTEDGTIRLLSEGYPMIIVDTADLTLRNKEYSTSTALVRGVCAYFVANGKNIGGFNATAHSTVFKGAGISSSASFELLVASILNELYNDGAIDEIFLAKAAHYAESIYFGKPCGLLDQCAIAFGGICFIDFSDGEPHPTKLTQTLPLSVILINTGGDHSSLTHEYASIRHEMTLVAKQFGKNVLREVSKNDFLNALPTLRSKVSGRAILRAMHFFKENERVIDACGAVESQNIQAFAEVINESGLSSMSYLQNCFATGDTAELIPSAVEIMKTIDGVKASRVHGGGFAGTIIAFAETQHLDNITDKLNTIFGKENYYVVNIRSSGATEITKELIDNE